MAGDEEDRDDELLRLVTRVARLYHTRELRQSAIAERLGLSQSRVSRLLQIAREEGIVRTVVVAPPGLHAELADQIEHRYGLGEVHVVDVADDDELQLLRDLGRAMASAFRLSADDGPAIGFTSWSRPLRAFAQAFEPGRSSGVARVVEMLGGVGPPAVQHEAANATTRMADLLHAEALFLRTPGLVSRPSMREDLLESDPYAREALAALDDLDLALVGIGECAVSPPLQPGGNFFTREEFARAREAGAVGQINLRFYDAEGKPVETDLDERVIGSTLAQLQAARRTVGVAGGPSKYEAIRGALSGGWMDTFITDVATAEHLVGSDDAPA